MKKSKLILLRKVRYGDADLILAGLTSAGTKVSFLARSALRSRKRFGGGVLEPTHYITASYKEPKGEGLGSLTEATLIKDFAGLKTDYERIETALAMVRMVDRLTQDGDMDLKGLFDLIGNALVACEMSKDLPKLRTHFEVKLLAALGIAPQWGEIHSFLEHNIGDHMLVEASIENPDLFSQRVARYVEDHLNVRLG